MDAIATTIGNRYDVLDKIGQGGMGTVYKGRDRQTKRDVAIKHLKPDVMGSNKDILERFRREGALLRELNHPNIIHLIDVVEAENQHYIVMEYVGGGSLSDLLRQRGVLPIDQVLQIALDLTDALTRAHRLGIIHRDLKPSNVLMAEDGTPRLSDFGIAHINSGEPITRTGEILGTIAYLPPESLQTGEFGERGDIWSLGIIIYQMLTGQLPFDHTSPVPTLITAILQQPIPDLSLLREDIPPTLQDLLLQMLAKNPNQRINSVRQVGVVLEALLSGTPITPLQITQSTAGYILPDTNSETLRVTPTPSSGIRSTDSLHLVQNAPTHGTHFVGRQRDLDELLAIANDRNARLITILGVGGAGKTRLAQQLANLLAPQYPDGAYFVPMSMVENGQQGIQVFADALGFSFTGNKDHMLEIMSYLQEKSVLLVFDSFEQAMDAAYALPELLRISPRSRLIVTSRERLNMQEEWVHTIQGLDFPAHGETPSLDYSALQLFDQVARRGDPDFVIAQHWDAVLNIVRLLDGSPLGIQLAAGWLNIMTVEEVAQEISDSLDFLETRLRDVPERQRSLRATFDYSWKTLSDEERTALVALSVFPGHFKRDAAKAVANASLRVLTTLGDKSKLALNKKTGDYTLHNMVRTFAGELLREDADLLARAQERMVKFYIDALQDIVSATTADGWKAAYARAYHEFPNLREAWHIAVKRGEDTWLDRLTFILWNLLSSRNMVNEAVAMFSAALDKGGWSAAVDAKLRMAIAWFVLRTNQYEAAVQYAQQAVERLTEEMPGETIGLVHGTLSYVLYRGGDYVSAQEHAKQAIAALRRDNVRWALALAIGNAGYVAQMRGDYQTAVQYLKEAYETSTTTGNLYAQAYSANNLGETYVLMGAYDHAEILFKEANAAFTEIGFKPGIAFSYANLGDLARLRNDFSAEAYQYFETAVNLYTEQGDKSGVADTLIKRSRFALDAGAYEEAHFQLEHALVIYRNIGQANGMIVALQYLGETAYALDNHDQAKTYFLEALSVGMDRQSERHQLDALFGLASLRAEGGDIATALQWLTLIVDHSATEYETRERAKRTLGAIRDGADTETVSSTPNLAEVVQQILA